MSPVAEVIVLGRAQDAGVPQAGCTCANCSAVLRAERPREYAACLALLDHATRQAWLIDCTPDFREQLALLCDMRPDFELAGIFISHAHVGHYAGLIHLGREAMNTSRLPVFATPSMCEFLRSNAPWSQLVTLNNIELRQRAAPATISLTDRLSVDTIPVPHRAEFSDTCAFSIRGPRRSIFYCPDIDAWDSWDRDLRDVVNAHELSIIDGTFYDPADELPGRDVREIPHPSIKRTLELLGDTTNRRVLFTHLNHSNPLLSSDPLRQTLAAVGFGLVEPSQTFAL
jgi:pyrroloquinoline quinone biosynthesis protein B